MRSNWALMICTLAVFALVATVGCHSMCWKDKDQKVTMDQVPPAAKLTIEKAANGAKIDEVEMVKFHDKAMYMAEFKVDGKEKKIKVDENGNVMMKRHHGRGPGHAMCDGKCCDKCAQMCGEKCVGKCCDKCAKMCADNCVEKSGDKCGGGEKGAEKAACPAPVAK